MLSATQPSGKLSGASSLTMNKLLDELTLHLTPTNHHLAVALAMIPEKIRGFGPVKQRHLAAAKAEEAALREQFRAGTDDLPQGRRIAPAARYNQFACDLILDRLPAVFSYRDNKIVQ